MILHLLITIVADAKRRITQGSLVIVRTNIVGLMGPAPILMIRALHKLRDMLQQPPLRTNKEDPKLFVPDGGSCLRVLIIQYYNNTEEIK